MGRDAGVARMETDVDHVSGESPPVHLPLGVSQTKRDSGSTAPAATKM
jgi:hypothetical protein